MPLTRLALHTLAPPRSTTTNIRAVKYIVDGSWKFDIELPNAMDDARNVNNVVTL